MKIQTNYDEGDRSQLYERHARATNLKARSWVTGYTAVSAAGIRILYLPISNDTNLVIYQIAALCNVAGSADFAPTTTDITISGGSAPLVFAGAILGFWLQANNAPELRLEGSFSPYEVPGGSILQVTITGESHTVPPEEITWFFDIREL
jgi:hypothetical protein